jgi:hypothetical protein
MMLRTRHLVNRRSLFMHGGQRQVRLRRDAVELV